jgi:hypothetical protein
VIGYHTNLYYLAYLGLHAITHGKPIKELVYIYIMRWENSAFSMAQEWLMSNLGIIASCPEGILK